MKDKKTDKKQSAETTFGRKGILLAVAVLLIAAIVVGVVMFIGRNQDDNPADDTQPVETGNGQELADPDQQEYDEMMAAANLEAYPVLLRDNYTSQANGDADMTAQAITAEGMEITNKEFSVWYWDCYYELVADLGYYASYYGLDTSAPLENQECALTGVAMTWQQFMIDEALYYWHSTSALAEEGRKAGVTASQEELTALEEQLEEQASLYGYSDTLTLVQAMYGSCVTVEDYLAVMETKIVADLYYAQQLEEQTPNQAEISAYYDEHSESMENQGIMKDDTPANVTIRQILVKPEGNATLAGTYSKEQMEQAQERAQGIMVQWTADGGTEDAFAALVKENSGDTSTKTTGGLYEAVVPGDMPNSINSWIFDTARQTGDTTIVETNSGVHILYFVSASEDSYWYTTVLDTMLQNRMDTLVADAMDARPYEVDFEKLFITTLVLPVEEY